MSGSPPPLYMVVSRGGPIRTLLVEHRALRQADGRLALLQDGGFLVVGQVATALEATRAAGARQPDLVLVDTTLPDPGPLELARFFRLRQPGTAVVFVSPIFSEDELFGAARIGVAAYLLANLDRRVFLAALRRAAAGEFLIDEEVLRHPTVASRVLAQFRQPVASQPDGEGPVEPVGYPGQLRGRGDSGAPERDELAPLLLPLSPREVEILDLIARGNSNKLIARRLGISDQTVKNHVTAILRKLEVNDRTEAVVFALRNGWIRIETSVARPAVR